jgi:starch phosphorylase
MKLALNGALTIGTLDGANVEILEEVGEENIFIFGNSDEQVHELLAKGYNPGDYYRANPELAAIIDWLGSDYFTGNESSDILTPLRDNLIYHDPYLCLADFGAYSDAQEKVSAAFQDKARWAKMAVLNTARVGKFSSDRTIREYARDIWKLQPVKVP